MSTDDKPGETPPSEDKAKSQTAVAPAPSEHRNVSRRRLLVASLLLGLAIVFLVTAIGLGWLRREMVADLDFRGLDVVATDPPVLDVGSIRADITTLSMVGMSRSDLFPCPRCLGGGESCPLPLASADAEKRGLGLRKPPSAAGAFISDLRPLFYGERRTDCLTSFHMRTPSPDQLLFELADSNCPVRASVNFDNVEVELARPTEQGDDWQSWHKPARSLSELAKGASVGLTLANDNHPRILWQDATVTSIRGRVTRPGTINAGLSTACNVAKNQDVWLVGQPLKVDLALTGGGFAASVVAIESAMVGGSVCRLAWSDRPFLGDVLYWLSGLCAGLAAAVKFFENLKRLLAGTAKKLPSAAPGATS